MLKPRDKIVVGLSGGKDSIALLYNLKKIQEKIFHSQPIIAITVDEGIKDYRSKKCDRRHLEDARNKRKKEDPLPANPSTPLVYYLAV